MRYVIGITGSIACGKSFVSKTLNDMGYPVIDTDLISHNLTADNTKVNDDLASYFPEAVSNGFLNRKKLGQIIFNDAKRRSKLNEILHPLIFKETKEAIDKNDGIIFVDVPLMFEAHFDVLCDKIICVYTEKSSQLDCLMKRDNISASEALKKIESQMPIEEKIKKEISVLAKDCQRLTLQQIDVVNQIFEKQIYIGNTTKICPICDKEVSISSNFCNRCGWTFPILYCIDENNTYPLDEEQLSIARTNWCSIIKNSLEPEKQPLKSSPLQATEEHKSMTDNKYALQNAMDEIETLRKYLLDERTKVKEIQEEYENLLKVQKNIELKQEVPSAREIGNIILDKFSTTNSKKYQSFKNKNDVFNFVRSFCKARFLTLNPSCYVADIQYTDLKDALYEKYNIHIGEHTLKCHSTLYKLVDSIWNEYTKHSNSDASR